MMEEKLYFIAIIPPHPHRANIREIKQSFAETYNVSHALKSPPHITIIPPFKMHEAKEKEVGDFLRAFTSNVARFRIEVEDYGCFKPRVIFLKPVINEPLKKLYENISREFYVLFPVGRSSGKPFHPHITIAFRDLNPKVFYRAWNEVKQKKYKAEFEIDRIFLLKHDGQRWQEHSWFTFHPDDRSTSLRN